MGCRFVLGEDMLNASSTKTSTCSHPLSQPLDMTLLDFHHGNLATWQQMVSEVHRRGMYVILDHTMST